MRRNTRTGEHISIYQRPYIRETMHSALNLRCTITAQLISAAKGHASQPKVSAMATDCSASRDMCSPDKHYIGNVQECIVSMI